MHDHNFKILENPHNFDLRVLESLWIHKLSPRLNDRSSSTELSIPFTSLFQTNET